MGVIPTRTDVISIVCVITFPTAGTGLTCISWVDIYNFNSCKGSLVFNEFCQTIEAPIMEAVIVFTACSCRLADAGKLLQFDSFYAIRSSITVPRFCGVFSGMISFVRILAIVVSPFLCYLFSKNASIAVLAVCEYRVSGCRAAKLSFAKRLFAEYTEYLVPFNFNCQAS